MYSEQMNEFIVTFEMYNMHVCVVSDLSMDVYGGGWSFYNSYLVCG